MHILRHLPSRPLVILAGLSVFVAYLSIEDLMKNTTHGQSETAPDTHRIIPQD